MSKPSGISVLPLHIQREVEEQIVANGFGGYKQLEVCLRERGFRISKSALHRFGQEIKALQLQANRAAMVKRAKARAQREAQ